ncbi:small-conductance mechanosensitive channel [Microbacterium halimionae]|uniref:Small-conductance mechanosensitive channel n=1 Tax=Microbacterium halimionae TaxID=1526413 RepID=A0A7W3PM04_9MICO|nr:hypothetical protein [Microbacterium halimionae]MBA8816551.1 small-conductance mechanosensitive channel [Microbacterium halimionae]NII95262.1 small-conductance mechanosensitive channel [Microbacterium halimionae]
MTPDPLGSGDSASTRRPRSWTVLAGKFVWPLLIVCVLVLFYFFALIFAREISSGLHLERPVDEQIPIFWGLVVVCSVLALVVVLAAAAKRWVALILALVLACMGGVAANMVFDNVRSVVAPVVRVDPEPIHCQCYSGSRCDCPGG